MNRWTIALVISTLALARAAVAAEPLNVVASPWPPYVDRGLEQGGVALHLVGEALRRAGYATRVTVVDWPQDLEATRAGEADVIAAIWRTEERARDLAFSEPYLVSETRFVKRRGEPYLYRSLDDLRGLRIGVVQGFAYGGEARDRQLEVTPVFRGSVLEGLRGLLDGELDLVLADERVALYELNVAIEDGVRRTEILPLAYSSRGLRIGVGRGRSDHAEIVRRFDAAIEAMRVDGSYAEVMAAHRVSGR